jgi:polygalacturonase
LVQISGSNIKVVGAPGSVLDGQGQLYWDGKGSNGGSKKPKFFSLSNVKQSTISGITIHNTPVHTFSVSNCENVILKDITIDSRSAGEKGHNTDAFDVGNSNGITIDGAKVWNQDDCLAINSGTNIKFINGYCNGGHGLSIGSVGGRSNNIVSDVTISNNQILNSQNGIRIKTISGATGKVSKITYSNIKLSNISKDGIIIEQDYLNGGPTGRPTGGIPITDVTITNVKGTVTKNGVGMKILCANGACSGWKVSGVSITGGKANSCKGVPSGVKC